ncbi:RNA-binding transcriptional accessory protein [Loigolactobacillus backii]|uniref:Tex family protein n=1 Tax=Loigolactobacillus backii TaxID=375175 RepID=UPI0007F1228B|nr:Tex family protein [Loigolactobacillus backii]ANK59030.1 RNA-binding transcriptional accessory protein [Loigolactobacillus backii]ANK64018.1 RNA-binding transcriptional accessory protein [Loigolactobacillus backii]PIO84004.1 RNA-binding transcriptional accessory protein [Loigolactobacillus backii]
MDNAVLQRTIKLLPQYQAKQIKATLELLTSSNTVPFVARYRKEATGNLDEVQIREIESAYHYQGNLSKRQAEVSNIIAEQDKLTDKLRQQIAAAQTLQEVEDLYLPYKQKRRTKATVAKESGLAPFATYLLQLPNSSATALQQKAEEYVDSEKNVPDVAAVFAGAHEILAEQFSDNADFRRWIRQYTEKNAHFISQVKTKAEDEKQVYAIYYDFNEPLAKMVSYRVLAINRGEKAGILKAHLEVSDRPIIWHMAQQVLRGTTNTAAQYVQAAIEDAYKRFIGPAIEREIRNQLTESAGDQAIAVFGDNLKHLLLQAPLKGRVVLGFDPAYRTGCKLAVVDPTGKFLDKLVIYPHKPANAEKRKAAAPAFKNLIEKNQVEMIAIGNGTASRESEQFVAEVLKTIDRKVYYVIVNEAGASVYSASQVARDEFPEFNVEERSAVSIARRLQDPLAELIKIDPKAVGVGQYQHDVSQKHLGEQLDVVVENVVNSVGVNVNTASPELLAHISGLTKTTAHNVVTMRNEVGNFTDRKALKKVPRLGPKAFEQSVGFLRIIGGKTILDNTDIHPESYSLAKQILAHFGLTLADVGREKAKNTLQQANVAELASEFEVGAVTLQDIIAGLIKPGRDLRDDFAQPLLRTDVLTIADLKAGMALEGTVRNVIDFGAFVDIGVKHDGLVHISQLADHFVKRPSDVVSVGDIVHVWVLAVDKERERVQLTMLPPEEKHG